MRSSENKQLTKEEESASMLPLARRRGLTSVADTCEKIDSDVWFTWTRESNTWIKDSKLKTKHVGGWVEGVQWCDGAAVCTNVCTFKTVASQVEAAHWESAHPVGVGLLWPRSIPPFLPVQPSDALPPPFTYPVCSSPALRTHTHTHTHTHWWDSCINAHGPWRANNKLVLHQVSAAQHTDQSNAPVFHKDARSRTSPRAFKAVSVRAPEKKGQWMDLSGSRIQHW